MKVQAEVSLYPLRIEHIGKPIERFLEIVRGRDIQVVVGTMSTRLEGEDDEVFTALREAFAAVGEEYEAALVMKVSNACPNGAGQRRAGHPDAEDLPPHSGHRR